MIAVTGATGQLGQLVIDALLKTTPAAQIVALVRDPGKAGGLAAKGVVTRQADYDDAAGLERALAGIDKLLLISSSAVGQRVHQHQNVIGAAKKAGVGLIAYTSLLHAETSPMGLAAEHRATEALLKASGVPYVLLRNSWYTENYLASIPAALQHGAFIGSAGEGRIASAPRRDYAEAAAAVLTSAADQSGKVYELSGDDSYTLADLAAEISRQAGRAIPYRDLPEAQYAAALVGAGLPQPLAQAIAGWDVGASNGALFDEGHQLSKLIGHRTTPLAEVVKRALKH